MKATLKFNIEEPEEKAAHRRAISADSAYNVLWTLDQFLRNKIRYSPVDEAERWKVTAEEQLLQNVRNMLHSLMEENGITLDDWV